MVSAISSIFKGFKFSLTRPWLFFPCLIASLIYFYIILSVLNIVSLMYIDLLIFGEVPITDTILDFVLIMFSKYSVEFISVFFAIIINSVIQYWLLWFFTDYYATSEHKKASFGESFFDSVSVLPNIFVLSFILIFVLGIVFFGMIGLSLLVAEISILNILVFLLGLLFFIYVYVKFSFAVPAFAITGKKGKHSIRESWDFTNPRLFSVFLLFVLIFFIVGIIVSIIGFLMSSPIIDSTIISIFSVIGFTISICFNSSIISIYFVDNFIEK